MKTTPDLAATLTAPLFLGLDSSTQGLKATVADAQARVVYEKAVNYDADLPAFKTSGGVHRHPDGLTVTSPPLLWVAALDRLLKAMKKDKFPFDKLAAVSGSGQQHGSVYLKHGAKETLHKLKARSTLEKQLAGIFAVDASPIWMDSSTARQCRERDAALGGPQAVAELTGSRSYERFTGNQIAKIAQQFPDAYRATDHIALVSSFMASLFIGEHAPIDTADGAGMNLMDLRKKTWAPAALACTAPDLEGKLGPIVPSHTMIGNILGWFIQRYGFRLDCIVIAFSGDNPNSLAALRLQHAGDIAISLGTSDTVFGALSDPKPSATEGHIFGNPIAPGGYMALVCYKNGSLTREHIRDTFAGGSWKNFDEALAKTAPGNGGKIGFFLKEPEITPPILTTGLYRFLADNSPAAQFTPEENVRAVVEGQFLSMRLHGGNIGLTPRRIIATGGASVNTALLSVMADVFGVPIYTSRQPNSASLGAALRALHGWHCHRAKTFVPFDEAVKGEEPFQQAALPDAAQHAVYNALLPRYAALEQRLPK